MATYEIVTRELYSRKKIPALRLRTIEPGTGKVLADPALPPDGSYVCDVTGRRYRVKLLGALVLMGVGYDVPMPVGDYLETYPRV